MAFKFDWENIQSTETPQPMETPQSQSFQFDWEKAQPPVSEPTPVTEVSPTPFSPEEQFGRVLGTIKGKPPTVGRPFMEEHPILYGVGKAIETLPSRTLQMGKEFGEVIASGMTGGLSEQAKKLGEYLAEKVTGYPVPKEEKILPEYMEPVGEIIGAIGPIKAIGKVVAEPLIKLVSKSRYLEPFAKMIGEGVTGIAYETAKKMASEGELPTPAEMAKSGGYWAGISGIFSVGGWTGRLAIGVNRLAKTWGIPRQEVLKTVLAEAKARKMPIARYAYAKAGVQKALGDKIAKSAEQLVDTIDTLHEPFSIKGPYQDLISQLRDEELTSKIRMFKDYAGKGIELGKEVKPTELIAEKAPEVRQAFEKPGFLRTAEEKLILREKPEPGIIPVRPEPIPGGPIEMAPRPEPMDITPGLKPIERMPLKEPFKISGEGAEVSMPPGFTTLGFGPAGKFQEWFERRASRAAIEKETKSLIGEELRIIKRERGFKGTEEAIDFGVGNKGNVRIISALREKQIETGRSAEKAHVAKDYQKALDLGVKSQLYREAAEAAEGKMTHEGYIKEYKAPQAGDVTFGFGPSGELHRLYEKTIERIKTSKKIEPPIKGELPGLASEQKNLSQKFVDVLPTLKKLRSEQEALYTQERGIRFGKAQKAGKEAGGGVKGYIAELKKLEGEMPKVIFEKIKDKFTQEDFDGLFRMVDKSPNVDWTQKLSVRNSLMQLFEKGKPPIDSVIPHMEKIFGSKLTEALLEQKGLWWKLSNAGLQIANMPKAIMASFDLSFGARQGSFMAPRYRHEFWKSWKEQFKELGSEEAYKANMDVLSKHPNFNLAKESGVSFTDIGNIMTQREERFASSWAEIIPGVRASGRAYTGFANKFRMDIFNSLLKDAETQGLNPRNNMKLLKGIVELVNNGTGRGSLGGLERSSLALNAFFFSPRLMSSRLKLLNPVYYIKQDPFVRKEALKSLLTFVGTTTTILTLAKLGGAEVETDPRSADFAKIKIGKTRIDILGGFQQYIRLAAQLASGKIVSSTTGKTLTLGEGYKPLTRLDILGRAIEYKEAPIFSFATMMLRGKTSLGEDIEIGKEIGKRFIPMMTQDIYDIATEQPELLPISPLGFFGFGMQTYGPKRKGLIRRERIERPRVERIERKKIKR